MKKVSASLALLLGIFILVVSSSSASYKEGREAAAKGSRLVIDLLRKDRVDGSYVDPELGCGIVFNGTKDGLTLSTLGGKKLLSTKEQVGPVRLVTLGNREFIQHRESVTNNEDGGVSGRVRDYAIPKYHGSFADTQDHEKFMSLLEKLRKLDAKAHSRVLEKYVKRTLSKCEIGLLSEAAFAMGHHHGISGQEYPSALPLYMTASRMKPLSQQITEYINQDNIDSSTPHQVDNSDSHERLKREGESCLDDCPPCKSQECLGMCGPGCSCWKWSCGNCCFNKGCYYHDLCCRSKPKSLACLLPMSFDCNSKYVCEDPKNNGGGGGGGGYGGATSIASLFKLE